MDTILRLVVLFIYFLPLGAAAVGVSGSGGIEGRLERVERVLGSSALVELLERVDSLEREVRRLRGQLEEQSHALSRAAEAGQDRYLLLDQRLRQLEPPVEAGADIAGEGEADPGAEGIVTDKISPPSVYKPTTESADVVPSLELPTYRPPEWDASILPESERPGTALPAPVPSSLPEFADLLSASDVVDTDSATRYEESFAFLRKGAYAKAIAAFQAFLEEYPDSPHEGAARYWLGEAYYVTGQYQLALDVFQAFVREHPSNDNFIDGLLKVGYVQHELAQDVDAAQTLNNLVEQYPDTTQAHLARNLLRKLQGE